jgi:aspartate carbamoyltransferase catalytic subunit
MKKVPHLLSVQDVSEKELKNIFKIADRIKAGKYRNVLKNKILATLFYEPSTRTRLSFESAMIKLDGNVISCENAKDSSSALKGETILDTLKVISFYADAIVIRHPESIFLDDNISQEINIPIINAGDGVNEHPTQAITDVYTIYKKFGRLKKLKIALVGDLKNGRTVHSLIQLLGKDNFIYLISPAQLIMPKKYLEGINTNNYKKANLSKIISEIDILYMTRIQKERFENFSEYKKLNKDYILSEKSVNKMKKDAMILHPLPRVQEIPVGIDKNPKAYYFREAQNGLFARMALLYQLLK